MKRLRCVTLHIWGRTGFKWSNSAFGNWIWTYRYATCFHARPLVSCQAFASKLLAPGVAIQDFYLFEKKDLSKKSGLLRVCKKGTVLKIRTFTKIRYTCENWFSANRSIWFTVSEMKFSILLNNTIEYLLPASFSPDLELSNDTKII